MTEYRPASGDRVQIVHQKMRVTDAKTGAAELVETITADGTVDQVKGDWVMVDLDEPMESGRNWMGHRMLVRVAEVHRLVEPDSAPTTAGPSDVEESAPAAGAADGDGPSGERVKVATKSPRPARKGKRAAKPQ